VSSVVTVAQVRRDLEKRYADSTELFPDFFTVKKIDVIPSPNAIVNAITGVGGFPRGRVTEVFGPEMSGKTTLAIELAVLLMQSSPEARVAFVDYEHAFDASYARALGLDLQPERFIFSQPESFEQGVVVIDNFVTADLVDLIIVDSCAAMVPKAELEGDLDKEGGTQKGLQSALMARFLARVTKKISRGRRPALVLLNQMRSIINIGRYVRPGGPTLKAAGGNAMKFYTSIRLELDIIKTEGDSKRGTKVTDQVYTQNRVRMTAVKNKLAPPFMRGSFVMEYGKGTNHITSIGELAEARLGIMSGSGHFKYDGDIPETSVTCRGRDTFLDALKTNEPLRVEIQKKVLDLIRLEHAASLGIEDIEVGGEAKSLAEGEPAPDIVLNDGDGMPAEDVLISTNDSGDVA
jgi:recombination protein RecA